MSEGGDPLGTSRCSQPRPSGNSARPAKGCSGPHPRHARLGGPVWPPPLPAPGTLGRLWPDTAGLPAGALESFPQPPAAPAPPPGCGTISFSTVLSPPLSRPQLTPIAAIRGLWQRPDPGPPGAPWRPSAAHGVALPWPVPGWMISSSGNKRGQVLWELEKAGQQVSQMPEAARSHVTPVACQPCCGGRGCFPSA